MKEKSERRTRSASITGEPLARSLGSRHLLSVLLYSMPLIRFRRYLIIQLLTVINPAGLRMRNTRASIGALVSRIPRFARPLVSQDPLFRKTPCFTRPLVSQDPLCRETPCVARPLFRETPCFARPLVSRIPCFARPLVSRDPLFRETLVSRDPLFRKTPCFARPLFRETLVSRDPCVADP